MPATAFFTVETFEFLRQLKRHNRREWFMKNKERYESCARGPALTFIAALGPQLRSISSNFVVDPHPTRGSLFRIYRDTRFSSDKRPYKTHLGMQFQHVKEQHVHAPGFYFHIEPEGCFIAAGIWRPDSRTATAVRAAMVARPEDWKRARRGIELEGDSLARPPRGYDPKHPFIDDLKMKDFIASILFTDEQICSPRLMTDFVRAAKKLAPLVRFTTEALGLEF
jgi:uncharacterized protein (TIGR02453 family)